MEAILLIIYLDKLFDEEGKYETIAQLSVDTVQLNKTFANYQAIKLSSEILDYFQ